MNLAPIALLLAATTGDDAPVSFAKDVAPILARNCLACHGSLRAESGLSMTTLASLRKGGKRIQEDTIVAGDPDGSFLVEVIRPDGPFRMPIKLPPLPDEQIKVIERWVEQGAKFDGGDEATVPLTSLVDPLRDLPPVAPIVPAADPVSALAYAPDGTLAAGRGEAISFLDDAGKEIGKIEGLPGKVTAARFTPDGGLLVVASGRPGQFGAITVWKVADRSKVAEAHGHADLILDADLVATPDGVVFATGSYDRLVKLWDLPTLKERHVLREHTDAVHAVAFSPDGKLVASAGADRTVKVWDVSTGKKRHSLSESTGELFAVVFGPDNRTVMAAGADRAIRAWDVSGEASSLLRTALAHQAPVLRLAMMPDGLALFSAGEDRTVQSWDWRALSARSSLPPQSDWVQAIAVRAGRLALGRYDGSLEIADPATGKALATPFAQLAAAAKPAAEGPKPQLARRASLNPLSPRSGSKGQTVRVRLTGNGVGRASDVVTFEPGLAPRIVPDEKPDPNALSVDLEIAPDAREGVHRLEVLAPLGVAPSQPFLVHADPEAAEVPGKVADVPFPSVLSGTIGAPGEEDLFRFAVKRGQVVVIAVEAKGLGSALSARLSLRRESGEEVASASARDNPGDPTLDYAADRDETLVLGIADVDRGASGNHFYRAFLGARPRATGLYPRGIEAGSQGTVTIEGVNLAQAQTIVDATKAGPGELRGIAVGQLVVVAAGPQGVEAEPNEAPGQVAQAAGIAFPGGISGKIDLPGDVDLIRFPAKKGERVILEVYGRRLGSPIDPILEILDASGKPVPRAVLRPVAETHLALRDHGSTQPNVRLTQWSDLAVGDYLLAGREVFRIRALPRNPDDDAIMYSSGGQRIGCFETTPEHHPLDQVLRKVEVHPPGTTFPAGSVEPVLLDYRNDDGGDGFGKDARITFDPPADGDYYARVADARGLGGPTYEYHCVLRSLRPDFAVSLGSPNPVIPRGGAAVVNVGLRRIDGFEGAVDVTLDGLPPGVTATPARIEAGQYAAEILLMANDAAPGGPTRGWKGKTVAVGGADSIAHEIDPGGPQSGWITVIEDPDLQVTPSIGELAIRPGETVEMSFAVGRGPAFGGRVPIEVKNLPFGVRVLNIGLNGVLVTEKQAERSVSIYAEPWAAPGERPFFAVGRVEANGTEHASPPIMLKVEPRPAPAPGPVEQP